MPSRLARCLALALAAWLWGGGGVAQAAGPPAWWEQAAQEARQEGYHLVDAPRVKALLAGSKGYLLLDVRPAYEYERGHLPGAVNLEFHLGHRLKLDPKTEEAFVALAGPDRQRPIIIYCRSFR